MQEATDPGARGSDGFANQCHVLHRKNAPRKAIETIKVRGGYDTTYMQYVL